MNNLSAIILAAGQGTRMKSKKPKVLHPLLGKPMLKYVIEAAEKLNAQPIQIVVGFGGEQVIETIGPNYQYVWQREQLGTGHAVMMAKEQLAGCHGDLLVIYGDTPLLKEETLTKLVEVKRQQQATASILTLKMTNPAGYGRIIRNSQGDIVGIVEDKDATPEQKAIDEVNTGIYCFSIPELLEALTKITPRNAQGEYYLTDVFGIFSQQGLKTVGLCTEDADQVMGPNDRVQFAAMEGFLRKTINEYWMKQGVTIVDSVQTYIGAEVSIGRDTILLPGCFLEGKTVIAEDCVIGPYTRLIDSKVGTGSEVQFSQAIKAEFGPENTIGPYSYVRPGTVTQARVKIGGFVEVKGTTVAENSKLPHLSYIGDTQIGKDVNIGAGTITCNYDGINKHRTVIGDEAFIGSNSNLVAPVEVGSGATVAAGSTITKEVPANALGIARGRQENILHWKSPRERAGK